MPHTCSLPSLLPSLTRCNFPTADCGKISKSSMEKGVWDAIHVLEVVPGSPAAAYKLSSTVMLSAVKKDVFRLEGSLTRQAEKKLKQADGHVPNVGTMVEEMEGDMRNSLHQVRPLRCPVYAFECACVRVCVCDHGLTPCARSLCDSFPVVVRVPPVAPQVYFGWCEQLISSLRHNGKQLPARVIEDLNKAVAGAKGK